MVKKFTYLLVAIVISIIFTGCVDNKDISIIHASDIHYISQSLADNSPDFVDMMLEADGKMTHYIDPIAEAFFYEVIEKAPKFLIISGDLTFNGEKQSHIDLAKMLDEVQKSGVTVLTIPGNHDIDYPFAMSYIDGQAKITERFLKDDYENIYQNFGLSKAISRDKETFSYFYKLSNKKWVLMLDVNTGKSYGGANEETLKWIEENLEIASKNGVEVIGVSHQNLIDQSNTLTDGFTIYNADELEKLYAKYNIRLNLSGHTHVQHISNNEMGTFDIAVGSLSVMSSQYANILIDQKNDKIIYKSYNTDVQGWAIKNNITDSNLLNFTNYSTDFFSKVSYQRIISKLNDLNTIQKEREDMANFFAEFNNYYFAGQLHIGKEKLIKTQGYALWQEIGKDTSSFAYIKKALAEERLNHIEITIE